MLEVSWRLGLREALLALLVGAACNTSEARLPAGQGDDASPPPAGSAGGSGAVVEGSDSGAIGGRSGELGGGAPAANEGHPTAPNEKDAAAPPGAAEIALFARMNGCTSDTETVFDELDTHCVRQPSCTNDAAVMSCTITGGGHAWPGGVDIGLLASLIMGPQSATLPTSQVMWDFLKVHRLP
jgi:hypothetical protein